MFVKQSNQLLYGLATLVVLILLGVGLVKVFGGVNQPATGPTAQTPTPAVALKLTGTDTPTRTPAPTATSAKTPTSIPAEAQLKLTSGYIEVDGANLYYEMMGSGPQLVLLHDLLLHREVWDGQFEVLAKESTVIRYDQRNYGLSDSSNTNYVDIEDLHALLQFLEIDRATLIGSSYGGQVALDFALTYPDKVAALVLVGAPISGVSFPDNDASSIEWRDIVLHRTFQVFRPSGRIYNANEAKEAIDWWLDFPNSRYWIKLEHAEVRAQARQLLLANLQNLTRPRYMKNPDQLATGRLSEIQVPTLVIVGEADTPGLLDHADRLATGITEAEKVIIPNAAHLVHLEQPEIFNQTVLDFLQRQTLSLPGQ